MRFFSAIVLLSLSILLSGCAQYVWAPDEDVENARYVHNGPPALMLITTVHAQKRSGAHSALMINADERVLFDPSGLLEYPMVERNDVMFGITPKMADLFVRAHVGRKYEATVQYIEVDAKTAAMVKNMVMENGPARPATCTLTVSSILKEVPGFEDIKPTWFPKNLSRQFGQMDGVIEQVITIKNDPEQAQALRKITAR